MIAKLTNRLSQPRPCTRKKVGNTWVTFEPLDADIIGQAMAIKTARVQGMQNPSKGKKTARSKAPSHRSITRIAMGSTLTRLAKEKLGVFA